MKEHNKKIMFLIEIYCRNNSCPVEIYPQFIETKDKAETIVEAIKKWFDMNHPGTFIDSNIRPVTIWRGDLNR